MSLIIQDLYWFKMLLSKAGDLFFMIWSSTFRCESDVIMTCTCSTHYAFDTFRNLYSTKDVHQNFVLIVPVCKMTKPFRNCYKLHSRFHIFSHEIKKL
uniref:Uncharacterized protein n=1 Tax=Populus trichocarpa TaxID=3694 RepID=A0A2K2B2J0_POPTR